MSLDVYVLDETNADRYGEGRSSEEIYRELQQNLAQEFLKHVGLHLQRALEKTQQEKRRKEDPPTKEKIQDYIVGSLGREPIRLQQQLSRVVQSGHLRNDIRLLFPQTRISLGGILLSAYPTLREKQAFQEYMGRFEQADQRAYEDARQFIEKMDAYWHRREEAAETEGQKNLLRREA